MTNESPQLTKRELEVLTELAKGDTAKQISETLHISTGTVESHRRNLILKFGAKNTVELVVKAVREGVV